MVIKDLLQGDQVKQENKTLRLIVSDLNTKYDFQKAYSDNMVKQVENLNIINAQKDLQLNTSQKFNKDLQKELKRERRKKAVYKLGSIVGLLTVAFLTLH